jgi:oligogalacturonide lyase
MGALLLMLVMSSTFCAADEPPTEWIDPDTGHKIIRLSTEPDSQSLYFHQNAYTPDGRKLMINTPSGISAIDLQTRQVKQIVPGRVRSIMAGYKTGDVYYMKDRAVWATSIDGTNTRQIARLPENGTVATVNCDETVLAGTITQPPATPPATLPENASRGQRIEARFNQRLAMCLFFIDVKTGEVKTFNHCTDWLNHLQFSPTDSNLLMFCHEGPWHKVDRTWTIRSDGSQLTKIHTRTMTMEIEGHEFFGLDGRWLWYDLQTPRGQVFWVAGYEVATGQRVWYNLTRDEWSVHFNVSPDGKLFAGDGGSEGMVAKAKDGKWIYLFRPEMLNDRGPPDVDSNKLIKIGVFRSERLVNMSKHDYALEPNVTFTPDMKWLVFRSNMHGPSHVYAVQIGKD